MHVRPVNPLNAVPRPPSRCEGGETVFYAEHGGGESARITPAPGLALLHRHGVDCWQHEALPVGGGSAPKYILRTDVVYGWS